MLPGPGEFKSSRSTFIENWLFEMPARTGRSNNNFDAILSALQSNIEAGYSVSKTDGLSHMSVDTVVFVWQEVNGAPEIIIELQKYQKGYAVLIVGKLPGSAISAELFYSKLLSVYKTLIFSGDIISDQGANIWKKLIASGHTVQVYNTNTASSKRLTDPAEIDNPDYDNPHTRFVLSETLKESMYMWNDFNLLRMQSLTHNMTVRQLLDLEN